MKKVRTRIGSIALIVALLLTLLPVGAMAVADFTLDLSAFDDAFTVVQGGKGDVMMWAKILRDGESLSAFDYDTDETYTVEYLDGTQYVAVPDDVVTQLASTLYFDLSNKNNPFTEIKSYTLKISGTVSGTYKPDVGEQEAFSGLTGSTEVTLNVVPASVSSLTITGENSFDIDYATVGKSKVYIPITVKDEAENAVTGACEITATLANGNNLVLDTVVTDGVYTYGFYPLASGILENTTVTFKAKFGDAKNAEFTIQLNVTNQEYAAFAKVTDSSGTVEYFEDVSDAFVGLQSGDEITILQSGVVADVIKVDSPVNFTLDLNGKTTTYLGDGTYALELSGGANLVIEDTVGGGSLVAPNRVIKVGGGTIKTTGTPAFLTVNGGTIQSTYEYTSEGDAGNSAIAIYANNSATRDESSSVPCIVEINAATIDGGIYIFGEGAELTVNNGAVIKVDKQGSYAISGNGSKGESQNCGDTVIVINGGTLSQTRDGGSVVYHPQDGMFTMNGGILNGQTGIQLCSGDAGISTNFQFNGGEVNAIGPDLREEKGTGDGVIGDGAAVSLVNRAYPGGIPTITINGGKFTSVNNDAVLAYTWSNGKASEWEAAADYLKVNAGTFSTDPKEYITAGKAVYANEAGQFVVSDAITGITLDKTELTLVEGGSETLTATVSPEDATDKSVSWASDNEDVATVNNGVVTAVGVGTANITATAADGTIKATCAVTVNAKVVPVENVTLNKTELTLVEGGSETLTATVLPENATDKSVTWDSDNEGVATVDENGVVTAVSAGIANITATAGGKTATCAVTVIAAEEPVIPVESVTLDKNNVTITEGSTATLTATVSPEDATDKSVSWASSNAAVATVNNGVVTAVSAGTANITATAADGKTATCEVTVIAAEEPVIPVESVTLDKNNVTITEGSTATLTATVSPEDATDKSVTWASGNEGVATVDENGVVTAVGVGTANITATAGGKTATCEVTVTAAEEPVVPVESVTLDKNNVTITEGSTATLTATVSPENATDKNVTWASDNEGVATVDENGVVTAVSAGIANITATAGGKSATCAVTVTAAGEVKPSIEAPEVDTGSIAGEDKQTAKDTASSVKADAAIGNAAKEEADKLNNNAEEQETLKEIAEGKGLVADSEKGESISLYTQTYLSISAKDLTKDEYTVYSITLDITPMFKVVASTAENSNDVDLSGGGNAVVVKDAEKLSITTAATISVTLPESFAGKTVYIKHEASIGGTYFYKAVAGADGSITFTSRYGFSPFTFSLTSETVAEVGDTGYASFQGAVNVAGDGETITVLKNENLTATVSGSSRTINIMNGTGEDITVTLNGTEIVIAAGATEQYTYTAPTYNPGVGGGAPATNYTITVPSQVDNGSIKVSSSTAVGGATVTVTVTPNEGYELGTLTVTDANGKTVGLTDKGDGVYTFVMPAANVEIAVTFNEVETVEPVNPFVDVDTSDYYYDAVLWAVANGITTGTTETTFRPDMTVTRAQMVTFLWRAAGSPEATGTNPFEDVSESDYYYDAVLWAVANGITTGTTPTTFRPDAPVTRAQAVTFQWRAAGSPAATGTGFEDVTEDAYYADAVAWAVEGGITTGTTPSTFRPENPVSRAQAVTFLYREAN